MPQQGCRGRGPWCACRSCRWTAPARSRPAGSCRPRGSTGRTWRRLGERTARRPRRVAAVHVGVAAAEPAAERVHHRRAAGGRAAHLPLDGVRARVVGIEHHPAVGTPDRAVHRVPRVVRERRHQDRELQRAGGREPGAGVVGGGIAARQAAHPDGADARAVDPLQLALDARHRPPRGDDAERDARDAVDRPDRLRAQHLAVAERHDPQRAVARRQPGRGEREPAARSRWRTVTSRKCPPPDTNTPMSVVPPGARPWMRPSDAS